MVFDPIHQPLPVHFFGSRPQPPTSPYLRHSICSLESHSDVRCKCRNVSSSKVLIAQRCVACAMKGLFFSIGCLHHQKILRILKNTPDCFRKDDLTFLDFVLYIQVPSWYKRSATCPILESTWNGTCVHVCVLRGSAHVCMCVYTFISIRIRLYTRYIYHQSI